MEETEGRERAWKGEGAWEVRGGGGLSRGNWPSTPALKAAGKSNHAFSNDDDVRKLVS